MRAIRFFILIGWCAIFYSSVRAQTASISKVKLNTPCVTCYITESRSQRVDKWGDRNIYNSDAAYHTADYNGDHFKINVEPYDVYTGRLELSEVHQREYTTQNKIMETVSQYSYNPNNLQINSIKTTESNGTIITKKFYYSYDFQGGIFDIMNQQNMISVPIAENDYVKVSSSGSDVQASSSSTGYIQLGNGDIKPNQKSIIRYSAPGVADGSSTNVQTLQYDNAGNLTGVKDEGGRMITNIYDYDDKFVTATVINADASTDKAAYTSFETGVSGGWSLSGSPVFVTTKAFTGKQALQLSSSLSAPLNPAKQYTLSFWATGGLSVTGASLTKSGPALNGFTYYEYTVQNSGSVTVSGSAIIDELRLYPKGARMQTVCYDPLIGKISECDENNRVTYYEYDDLGRLQYVKDENKNIVKAYEHNVTKNQFGCPRIYYNKTIKEIIKANNCQGDNVGKEISYTIPANKYSSTISQANADSMAEQELRNQGQAQANNAGCAAVYYNDAQSGQFLYGDCGDGYKGTYVTYTVPARTYSSLISKDDANQQALDDLNGNGDAFANDPNNGGSCVIDTDPEWEADDPPQTRCGTGSLTGHEEAYMKDVNPNSSTYNTWQWIDMGVDDEGCPVSGPVNLISNGDFEQGVTGFSSDYTIVSPGNKLTYGDCSVTTNPYTSNSGWCQKGDHTSGSGKMMVADGSDITAPPQRFWYTTVNVQPNTNYVFSFWCMNLYGSSASNVATIRANINGGQVLSQALSTTTCAWQQLTVTWNSGQTTSAALELVAPTGVTIGNDFALDDISFIRQ